jgi:hypothetical protein
VQYFGHSPKHRWRRDGNNMCFDRGWDHYVQLPMYNVCARARDIISPRSKPNESDVICCLRDPVWVRLFTFQLIAGRLVRVIRQGAKYSQFHGYQLRSTEKPRCEDLAKEENVTHHVVRLPEMGFKNITLKNR